ncbi:hypothetical protein ACFLV2_02525 [Chloroflexota bacterium]
METAVISIICIALIVFGGMTMSQGFFSTADATGMGVEEISMSHGEIMRTGLSVVSAERVQWADILRVRLENSGQTKLASFSKWDVIAGYLDDGNSFYATWLPYTEATLQNNEWEKIGLYVNGQVEAFEPAILNPGEEMVIGARFNPAVGDDSTANITIGTPGGVNESVSFPVGPDYPLLVPHAEDRTIDATAYYLIKEGASSDGAAITNTTDVFAKHEVDRKILYNEHDPAREARHVYSLAGIDQIPAATWTVYYRCRGWDFPDVKDGDVNFDIDILVRQADGTVRTIIATDEADAYFTKTDPEDTWMTKSGTYDFPGYTVVDPTDYLEIVFYAQTDTSGPGDPGYLQLRIDDGSLALADQTRIEA